MPNCFKLLQNSEIKNYQSITPDDMESFSMGSKSAKHAKLNPFQESGHQPPKIYTNSPNITIQVAMIIALIAPGTPQFNLITKIQDKRM